MLRKKYKKLFVWAFVVSMNLLIFNSCSKGSIEVLNESSKLTPSEVNIQLYDENNKLLTDEATVIISKRRPDVNMLVPRIEAKVTDGQLKYKIFASTDVRITVLKKGYKPIYKDVTLVPEVKEHAITLTPKTGLTVLSYNVKDGFEYKNSGNMDRFRIWVTEIDPDVIVFQELVTFTHSDLSSFANSLGHEFSYLLKEEGYPTGITSKHPINNAERVFLTSNHPPYRVHGYISAETAGLNIFAVHFSSQSNDLVFQEATHILAEARLKSVSGPVLIAGDYNSISPVDEQKLGSIVWTTSMQKYRPSRIPFDYRTMNMFEESDFKDAVRLNDNKYYKASFPVQPDYYTADFLGFRLDYAYLSETLSSRCSFAEILQDSYTNNASDHYPYLLHFEQD